MRLFSFSFLILVLFSCQFTTTKQAPQNTNETTTMADDAKSIYDITVETIDGKKATLAAYKGKKILIVNVASECGFTSQYTDLQETYAEHKDELVVLGFPCNQFGGQEPGSNEEIAQFCSSKFSVDFPMYAKLDVKGNGQHELYQWLTDKSQNGWNDQAPTWNFCKYLISEDGKLKKFYASAIKPGEIAKQVLAKN